MEIVRVFTPLIPVLWWALCDAPLLIFHCFHYPRVWIGGHGGALVSLGFVA